jgi:hypothetical protein
MGKKVSVLPLPSIIARSMLAVTAAGARVSGKPTILTPDKANEFFAPVALLIGGTGTVEANSPVGERLYTFLRAKSRELKKAVAAREEELKALLPTQSLPTPENGPSRYVASAPVRMSEKDLEFAVRYGAHIARNHLEMRVLFDLEPAQVDAFWTSRDLTKGDWIGLSKQLLSATFGDDILVPMEATDNGFTLQVKPGGIFQSVDHLMAGGSGLPDAELLPQWSARAPAHPVPTVVTASAASFCRNALASYGAGIGSYAELKKH